MSVTNPDEFIRANLPLRTIGGFPEVRLRLANPTSKLGRFVQQFGRVSPYWAYAWAGGLALARHVSDQPATVAGRRVLDLGTGSGLVGIAAVRAGAASVLAVDSDPLAIVAAKLNAEANGVSLETQAGDVLEGDVPDVDVITVGDLFYADELATRVTRFLDRCVEAGIVVLVGDPGRTALPVHRLRLLAEYDVRDFGQGASSAGRSAVYAFEPVADRGNLHHVEVGLPIGGP